MAVSIGDVIGGKYELRRLLGEGGMGVIFEAEHKGLGRKVAIKMLRPGYGRHPVIKKRFVAEARAAALLNHPNVVDVLDVDVDGDIAFMVLEFLDGETLTQRLERGPMGWVECWALMEPVLDALRAAHEAGIIHRDLKPDNLFLARDGRGRLVPKILDFGIAKLTDSKKTEELTRTGAVMGTPYYMAPEQALGKKTIGPWTDVWAMAVVLFECLSNEFPIDFDLEAPFPTIAFQINSDPARSITEFADVPEYVERTLKSSLEKDPAARLRGAGAMLACLAGEPDAFEVTKLGELEEWARKVEAFPEGLEFDLDTALPAPTPVPMAAPPPSPLRRALVMVGVVALVLLTGAIAYFAGRGEDPPTVTIPATPPPTATATMEAVSPPSTVDPAMAEPPPEQTMETETPEPEVAETAEAAETAMTQMRTTMRSRATMRRRRGRSMAAISAEDY